MTTRLVVPALFLITINASSEMTVDALVMPSRLHKRVDLDVVHLPHSLPRLRPPQVVIERCFCFSMTLYADLP